MNEITSVSNEKIKELSKLHQTKYRNESQYFMVEGKKSLQDMVDAGVQINDIFMLKSDFEKLSIKSNKIILCSEPVMKKLSSTDSPSNVVTVAIKPEINIQNLKKLKKIALFENIKDAGNLGTIIRSAAAFGIDAIILFGKTVDLYNPKVIRSCAGNFFKVPVVEIKTLSQLQSEFSDYNFVSTALLKTNNMQISELNINQKNIIMFGSEAEGLSLELSSIAKQNILIEMNKNVESLNLSVAASIVFYELYKKPN